MQSHMEQGIIETLLCCEIDAPAVESRRRFEGGSARHLAAMAGFPASRRLEIAPLRYLLPESRSCLLDLFAGTGFASDSIRRLFGGTYLLEPHVAAAAGERWTSRRRQQRACALSDESFEGFPQADLAVCLAGFHHVLGPGAAENRDSCRRQRLEALRLWRSRLAPGGRLVIADVPATGAEAGWAEGDLNGLAGVAEHDIGFADSRGSFAGADRCHGLGDYLASMTALCRELQAGEPEPASFFDRIVSEQSPYGHVASFDSPQELTDLFREAGFEHVRAFVAPTPWLFPTKAGALWFVHELLGIGQPCGSSSDLPTYERASLEAGIRDHLDLRRLPDGGWAISWKLMYVVGDRP